MRAMGNQFNNPSGLKRVLFGALACVLSGLVAWVLIKLARPDSIDPWIPVAGAFIGGFCGLFAVIKQGNSPKQ